MSESRQLSVRLSASTFARLEEIKPAGVSLAEVARKIIERQLGTGVELPSLTGQGIVRAQVDMRPVLVALQELQERVEEAQTETLRAVHEHGVWLRRRVRPIEDAATNQEARDAAVLMVEAWERSVGRR
jgi:hypothetical protein